MNFDEEIIKKSFGSKVRYGIVHGNENIVFIKSGSGGSNKGRGDKYLKMAQKLRERLGATVICASNPVDDRETDEEMIREVISKRGFAQFKMYFVGSSDGGYQNLVLASQFPETVKFLGINTSCNQLPDFEKVIKKLPDVEKIFVYGTKDWQYKSIVPFLKQVDFENFQLMEVEGVDHDFTGRIDEVVSLVDML